MQNKPGIEDVDQLKKAAEEEEIVAARMVEIIENPVRGNFDFIMLKAIHKKLFSKENRYLQDLSKDDFIKKFAALTGELQRAPSFQRRQQKGNQDIPEATGGKCRMVHHL